MTWLLVAEDNEDLREVLADALRKHRYEVRTAADGAEVVRILDEAEEMPAVLLLDMVMPRVSGYEVLRAMRSLGKARRVPVVVLTGTGEMTDADVRAYAVTEVLHKPVLVEQVLAAIDMAARRS